LQFIEQFLVVSCYHCRPVEEAQQPVQEAENQPILQEVPGKNTKVKTQQEVESARVNVSSGMVGGIRAVSTPIM
jgi:hypothetical protein